MTKSNSGSVRIGPVSLFTLVVLLCAAVLSVLAVSTSQATLSMVEKQAEFTKLSYVEEAQAWQAISVIDDKLASAKQEGLSKKTVMEDMANILPATANIKDDKIDLVFETEGGRTLKVGLIITDNLAYEINYWTQKTERHEEIQTGDTFWSGNR